MLIRYLLHVPPKRGTSKLARRLARASLKRTGHAYRIYQNRGKAEQRLKAGVLKSKSQWISYLVSLATPDYMGALRPRVTRV